MRKRLLCLLGILFAVSVLAGCQQKDPEPGEVAGYDEGEEYLSIWVHSIEDTEEGQAYRESVDSFNEAYDGTYFADIEFVPRNDSGGGYSDKVNASVMALLNIPDKYAMERGGWKSDKVMKKVYMQTFSEQRNEVDQIIDKYFESKMQHEMQHEKKKVP